ncbi:Ankyrin repeat family protein [Abeliophyllum distichum]|uniref:Ankyrin repeat family protein n=1 Tax=Abeliophyllum distichum TaxID=126358 RepID=A0ABD1V7B1_9LAMI
MKCSFEIPTCLMKKMKLPLSRSEDRDDSVHFHSVEDAPIGLQQVCDALILGKERVVDRFLRQYKTSEFTERITASGETALMVAIKGGNGHIINKLVSLTPPELLDLKDNSDNTALHVVAELDNVKAAQLLVNKNHELLNICNRREILPIHLAAIRGHREMTSYLFSVGMKDEIHSSLPKDADGERLMLYLVTARFYDLALQLLGHNLEVAFSIRSPLKLLANDPSVFPSGTSYSIWESFFYSC